MNLTDIHYEDWQYIFRCYPGLEMKLTHCALWNEALRLTKELKENVFIDQRRKVWVETRLSELNILISGR